MPIINCNWLCNCFNEFLITNYQITYLWLPPWCNRCPTLLFWETRPSLSERGACSCSGCGTWWVCGKWLVPPKHLMTLCFLVGVVVVKEGGLVVRFCQCWLASSCCCQSGRLSWHWQAASGWTCPTRRWVAWGVSWRSCLCPCRWRWRCCSDRRAPQMGDAFKG